MGIFDIFKTKDKKTQTKYVEMMNGTIPVFTSFRRRYICKRYNPKLCAMYFDCRQQIKTAPHKDRRGGYADSSQRQYKQDFKIQAQ